jgi:hypothetical protein
MTRRWPTTTRIAARMVIAASLLPVGEAWAEPESAGPPTISVGSRVRFEAPTLASKRIEGTVIGLDEKALVVRRHDREPQTVSREAITHLEVSTGRRRQVLRGMLIGTGIGVLGMGVICSGRYDECAEASPVAMAGALLGTGIGALVKSDRWTAVPLDRVRVTLTPARRGVCLAVSIGF